jgi:hypothetical protein
VGTFAIRDGVLALKPLDVGFAGGRIAGDVQLDYSSSSVDQARPSRGSFVHGGAVLHPHNDR